MIKAKEMDSKKGSKAPQQSKQKPFSAQLNETQYENEDNIVVNEDNLEEDEEIESQNYSKGDKLSFHSTGELSEKRKENKVQVQKNFFISYPVIAILSLPSGHVKYPKEEFSYIYTSYVQYFQQSGARIIPIKWTESEDFMKNIMNKVNGLVLTGGGTNLMMRQSESAEKEFTQFSKVGMFLIDIAKQKNESGNYFPIWGTCLGFELLLLYFAQSEIRNIFDSKNHFTKQIFTPESKDKSKMLSDLSKSQIKCLEEEGFFFYNHKNAISKKVFQQNPKLNQNFNCIACSKDLKGKTFVSIAESKTLPFYGTQFHPEKLQYDHTPQYQKKLTMKQLKISQHFPNFFYMECLRNNQRFESLNEQQQYLIENFQPIYLQNLEQGMYLFNNSGLDQFRIQNEKNSL